MRDPYENNDIGQQLSCVMETNRREAIAIFYPCRGGERERELGFAGRYYTVFTKLGRTGTLGEFER